MKYRFSPSHQAHPTPLPNRRFVFCGKKTVKKIREEIIPIDFLFASDALPKGKRSRRHPFAGITALCKRAGASLSAVTQRAVRRMAGDRTNLIRLWGALCASFAVTLTASILMLATLFGRYNRPSTSVPVPDFLGGNVETVLAEAQDPFTFLVQYEYNDGYRAGAVISQSPAPGVIRRLYGKNDKLTVTLTVCREHPLYTLPALIGLSRRDAELALRREGIAVEISEEYSDTVASGKILRSEPKEGEHIAVGSTVHLVVSLGKKENFFSVPDLLLLSENAACAVLEQAGFSIGTITYEASELPAGSVIRQSVTAGTTLAEGSSVSFSVSLGQRAPTKSMPNLFGLTLEEARSKLREVGLTIGKLSYLPHASPSGTVIEQSVPAGTPLTSAIFSADLILSQ